MPERTPEAGGAGTAPAENTEPGGQAFLPVPPDAEPRSFTQEDVDRIVTERLRRERQRVEKAVRDEFGGRIAELEAAGEEAQQVRGDVETLSGALRGAEQRALIAERLLAKGAGLPPPYAALVKGEDAESIDDAIDAAREQWAADLRLFAKPAKDVGAPVRATTGAAARATRVDADLAERMRRGETEAFREYHAMRR
jgi:hypothetical protein